MLRLFGVFFVDPVSDSERSDRTSRLGNFLSGLVLDAIERKSAEIVRHTKVALQDSMLDEEEDGDDMAYGFVCTQ